MGRLIALHGLAGSGKSTACQIIEKEMPDLVRVKFAGVLKDMMRLMLSYAYPNERADFFEEAIEGKYKEVSLQGLGGLSPRIIMQVLGNDFRSKVSPNLWSTLTCAHVTNLLNEGKTVCIDDLRFPAECAMLYYINTDSMLDTKVTLIKVTRKERARETAESGPMGIDIFESLLDEVCDKTVEYMLARARSIGGDDSTYNAMFMYSLFPQMNPYEIKDVLRMSLITAKDKNDAGLYHVSGHSSESGLSDHIFDAVIENDGSREDFQQSILSAIRS